MNLKRYGEAKVMLSKVAPVARRVLGDNDKLALKMRFFYAAALYQDDDASPDETSRAAEHATAVRPDVTSRRPTQ